MRGPVRKMEVAIPHNNLRVFAHAVQCLGKVGKELFMETTSDQLILRTLNDSKSAFAAFYFQNTGFFEALELIYISHTPDSIPPCDLQVWRLVIYVEGEDEEYIEPHLVFQMHCDHG
ncbi:unnamed protein product, partial [Choristocarpus tenellus]